MPRWRVEFRGKAEDDLVKLERPLRRRIIDRLEWLAENFEEITPLPLGGEWKGFFKFRAGDWRIIYTIESEEKIIAVRYIDNRDKIYKRKG
ncbi:MAG: type II toxin-antitoxin system RelE/ParE family toxin [bacterium]|nr:type II toxin-antitoxin system RelE/ParE family toxin [bacterium]